MTSFLNPTTDYHCHLAPGLDHGSPTVYETVLMAQGLVECGVEIVHSTPHQFRFGIELGQDELLRASELVQGIVDSAGIPLLIVPACEYYYGDRFLDAIEREEELFGFTERDELWVLIEFPSNSPAFGAGAVAKRLLHRGIRPVLAHPERISALQDDAYLIEAWANAGWKFQLDLLSLVGRYGARARALAERLVLSEVYTIAGSDLHRASELEPLRDARGRLAALDQESVLQ